jgi:L-lactate dehydrogenase complex protein LldG
MAAGNPSREQILERIRSNLRVPVPPPAESPAITEIFEPVLDSLQRFQQECQANLMECHIAPDKTATAQLLAMALEPLPAGAIFVQDEPGLRSLIAAAKPDRAVKWSNEGAPAESSQATITLADALIAQTGSIFVSASCGGRGASVVAPCHVVIARASQLVPDLETALRDATSDKRLERNSYACIISGSSRTADIEKILVQGAHGPIRLVVIVET